MPCASLELCSLVGLAGGQVAPCRGQMGCGCGGPSFLEVRKDAGDWNVEDELSDCRRPCQRCCTERAAALGTAGELGVTSAKGRPGVGSVGSGLSHVGGPGGGELEDTVSPGHASWGPSQQSIRGATGRGGPTVTEGQLGVTSWWGPGWWELPCGGSRPPRCDQDPQRRQRWRRFSRGGAALMEGRMPPPVCGPRTLAQALVRVGGIGRWGAVQSWPGGGQHRAPRWG